MHQRACLSISIALTLVLGVAGAGSVEAARPAIERDAYTDHFPDDFILELCGIDTWTTVTERWTSTVHADGSETFQVVRTFVPDDPRIPIERGAATAFFSPDGGRRVVGKPLHLFKPRGGVLILDAGLVDFDSAGNVVLVRGPHPSLEIDPADLYCP